MQYKWGCTVNENRGGYGHGRRHGNQEEDMETQTMTWKLGRGHENIKTWKHGDMEGLRHGDMKTWGHGNIRTWKHG